MKLLILHPDDFFRSRLVERMRLENHTVLETSLESEASDILHRDDPDVILLGATGPSQNRLAFLKTIREVRPYSEVILLTAAEEHSFDGGIKAMQLGAFDDLLLPIDIQVLADRIREAHKKRKTRLKDRRRETTAGKQASRSETRLPGPGDQ
ncbi:MAG: response regulator [Thermodesulfobacteriota bacterium]